MDKESKKNALVRTKLFISHATPTDNEFAAWLAAKLELHGYDVWVDIKELDPATDFWNMIKTTIRDHAIKFLFVASRTSVLGNLDGIKKELAVADRVRKTSLPDFIVPLRIDDVSFDDFPVEILRRNAIDFYSDWADGLLKLLEYLDKQGIARTSIAAGQMAEALQRWKDISTSESAKIITTSDQYYSNLFPVALPQYLYAYDSPSIVQALKIGRIPYRKINSCILTFACPCCIQRRFGLDIKHMSFEISSILTNAENVEAFDVIIKRPDNLCVALINYNIDEWLNNSVGLIRFRSIINNQSKNKYYFKRGFKSKRNEASRSKVLSGAYKEKSWHYAQSAYFTQSF